MAESDFWQGLGEIGTGFAHGAGAVEELRNARQQRKIQQQTFNLNKKSMESTHLQNQLKIFGDAGYTPKLRAGSLFNAWTGSDTGKLFARAYGIDPDTLKPNDPRLLQIVNDYDARKLTPEQVQAETPPGGFNRLRYGPSGLEGAEVYSQGFNTRSGTSQGSDLARQKHVADITKQLNDLFGELEQDSAEDPLSKNRKDALKASIEQAIGTLKQNGEDTTRFDSIYNRIQKEGGAIPGYEGDIGREGTPEKKGIFDGMFGAKQKPGEGSHTMSKYMRTDPQIALGFSQIPNSVWDNVSSETIDSLFNYLRRVAPQERQEIYDDIRASIGNDLSQLDAAIQELVGGAQ